MYAWRSGGAQLMREWQATRRQTGERGRRQKNRTHAGSSGSATQTDTGKRDSQTEGWLENRSDWVGSSIGSERGTAVLGSTYVKWTKNADTAACGWCQHKTQTREHLFKDCKRWKAQQKIQWAEVREEPFQDPRPASRRKVHAIDIDRYWTSCAPRGWGTGWDRGGSVPPGPDKKRRSENADLDCGESERDIGSEEEQRSIFSLVRFSFLRSFRVLSFLPVGTGQARVATGRRRTIRGHGGERTVLVQYRHDPVGPHAINESSSTLYAAQLEFPPWRANRCRSRRSHCETFEIRERLSCWVTELGLIRTGDWHRRFCCYPIAAPRLSIGVPLNWVRQQRVLKHRAEARSPLRMYFGLPLSSALTILLHA